MSPRELIDAARAAGLNGVVITEHDHLWSEAEIRELQREAGDLLVLAGVEVSAIEGHFLVYGLPDMDEVYSGITLDRLLGVTRRVGAAVVAAHPYRWEQDFDSISAQFGHGLDAVELVSNNVSSPMRRRIEALLGRHPFGATGSSDAHQPAVVGCYFTELPKPIASMSDFVAMIKSRCSRPSYRPGAHLTSGPIEAWVRPALASA
jgi:predicted metal-dependent phosphoesterase TrpH